MPGGVGRYLRAARPIAACGELTYDYPCARRQNKGVSLMRRLADLMITFAQRAIAAGEELTYEYRCAQCQARAAKGFSLIRRLATTSPYKRSVPLWPARRSPTTTGAPDARARLLRAYSLIRRMEAAWWLQAGYGVGGSCHSLFKYTGRTKVQGKTYLP